MNKVKQILCIYPEPEELRISPLLNRKGVAVDLTEASVSEALSAAFERPQRWDLVLCDADAFFAVDIAPYLDAAKRSLDASLVLLRSSQSSLTPAEGFSCGAADVVVRDDMDHLIMVCEREIRNVVVRKQLRELKLTAAFGEPSAAGRLAVATINDLGKSSGQPFALESHAPQRQPGPAIDPERAQALVGAGGLTLEYQPIISFRSSEAHRNMFETLVRLRDEAGAFLLPDEFLPSVVQAGWMGRVDLWICRQAIAVLEQMQAGGARDATLFVNLADETLRSAQHVKAIGAFLTAAHLAPGSVVIEVKKSAFSEAAEGLAQLASMLKNKKHGLLVEDPALDDCELLQAYRDIVTHVKLSRATTQGLVEGVASQQALNAFVGCAHHEGMRVIALAVERADLLPILFAAGVDAIQGNFTSTPSRGLMYPSVTMIEPGGVH